MRPVPWKPAVLPGPVALVAAAVVMAAVVAVATAAAVAVVKVVAATAVVVARVAATTAASAAPTVQHPAVVVAVAATAVATLIEHHANRVFSKGLLGGLFHGLCTLRVSAWDVIPRALAPTAPPVGPGCHKSSDRP